MGWTDRDHRGDRGDRRDRAQVVPLDRRDRGRAGRRSASRSASSARTTRSRSGARPATRPRCSCPGLRFKLWPLFGVKKYPWVQVPAGEIGVVIAQVGEPLPIGAKSAVYKTEFGELLEPAQRSSRTAGRRACSARSSPRARSCRSTRSRSSCVTTQGVYGLPVSPDLASQSKGGMLVPGVVRSHARAAARRRDRARRRRST